LITIEGAVEEIIFNNEVNGYTVCEIRRDEDSVTAVGFMPFINAGETLRLTGRWVNHPDYGQQFKVEAYEKIMPQTSDAIMKYLASGLIKGVGPATAAKIVERFGKDTLDIIQIQPERLAEVKGISFEKALRIGQAFEEQRDLRKVIMFLQEYGISPAYATKIYRAFGEGTIDEIKSNPFRLADEIFGIGFKTADRIARSLGIDPYSRYRICSAIKYVLSQGAAGGHTYIPEDKLKEYASSLLEINIDSISDALLSLALDKAVFLEKTPGVAKVYLSAFHNAELGVCRRLFELSRSCCPLTPDDFDSVIRETEEEEGITLDARQKLAIREAVSNGVTVVTGGPGTGKTTITKCIIKLLKREGYGVALAAPTGRAAKRMAEATGFEAKTIHRLLEIGYMGADEELVFSRNESNPIDAGAVIIDEMSMVDILLMNHLLKAIRPGTRLVLIGDADQLPPVGAGNVLKDIIDSKAVRVVELTDIYRQAGKSMIVVNAHRINGGEYPYLNRKDGDFFFIPRANGDEIVKTIIELCCKRLPESYGYDPMRHIQVLSPTRKGTAGVYNLNLELQKALNPEHRHKSEKTSLKFTYREGDRVMQVKNNYSIRWEKPGTAGCGGIGVFNGDTGIIRLIDNEEQKLEVLFEDERVVEYDFSILDELEPAFAVTIHKSQGSEFPAVVMPVFPGPPMLMTRNLLYTAVTRAKDLVVLVGLDSALAEMVKTERENLRYSGLADKLRQFMVDYGLGFAVHSSRL